MSIRTCEHHVFILIMSMYNLCDSIVMMCMCMYSTFIGASLSPTLVCSFQCAVCMNILCRGPSHLSDVGHHKDSSFALSPSALSCAQNVIHIETNMYS